MLQQNVELNNFKNMSDRAAELLEQARSAHERYLTGLNIADLNDAVDMYIRALKTDPAISEVYYRLACLLWEKGDISLDDLSRLFHDLNSDKAVGELFDNIRGITGSVLLITFSHSQHHSRVDVQLTTQFSAYFQRGLALAVHLI